MELLKIAASQSGGDEQISRQMEALRDRLGSAMRIADELTGSPVAPVTGQPVTEQQVRGMLKLRRNRDRFFGKDLFADPAWDILLELYAAALAQHRVSVTSLCIAAAVPATTALRWIKHLEEAGLIVRRADPTDGRRQFMMLSEQAIRTMNAYFRTVPADGSVI
jgi:DNA-binding MarR family transcriptional regulator